MLLIVIGALIIAAVVVVNWWQEKRFHKQVESSFSSLKRDVLLDEPNLEATNLADESKLDAANLQDAKYHEDDAFDNPSSDTDFSFDINAIDAKSIDENYSRPANSKSTQYDIYTQIDSNPDVNSNVKLAQHDDIKAIFEDAFSFVKKAEHDKPSPYTRKTDIENEQAQETSHINEFKKSNDAGISSPKAESLDSSNNDSDEPEFDLPASLHNQIDLTAILYLAIETPFNVLENSLNSLLNGYDKPIFVHLLTPNKEWYLLSDAISNQQIAANQLVSRIACSIQLADRAGAVTRNTLNRFQLAVETTGLDMNAHVEWQSTGDALATATALDTFCIEVDKTIGFHLVHGENGAFTGTKLRGLAEAQGLVLKSDGAFKYFDEALDASSINTRNKSKQASFIMFNRDDHPFSPEMLRTSVVKGITFQFDIPHVKQCGEVFTQMVQVARQMETGLNAVLVDDNNKLLGDIQIEKIRQQLKMIHATMLVRGVIPGSDSALRLFS